MLAEKNYCHCGKIWSVNGTGFPPSREGRQEWQKKTKN